MNVTELVNATLGGGVTTSPPPYYSLNGLKFGEDGVRQPPSFTASNNVIIMVLGLSLLIVPIVGFLICMCAKSRTLKVLRGMKFTAGAGDGSGLPYSQFDSEPEDFERASANKASKGKTAEGKNKDVRVLINNDNTFVGTPTKKGSGGEGKEDSLLRRKSVSSEANSGSRSRNAPLNDDYATLDVDATFIVPSNINSDHLSSEESTDHSTVRTYPYVSHSYT